MFFLLSVFPHAWHYIALAGPELPVDFTNGLKEAVQYRHQEHRLCPNPSLYFSSGMNRTPCHLGGGSLLGSLPLFQHPLLLLCQALSRRTIGSQV